MLEWIKQLFQSKTCAICKKKAVQSRPYYDDQGKPILACHLCVEYAERRMYRRR